MKSNFKNTIRTAVIDIGTLKSKFEIREYDESLNSKVVAREKELTVLGRDLDKTGNMIIRKSIDTTLIALMKFKDMMKSNKVDSHRVVTTEAIRKALNSKDVIDELESRSGLKIEVLSHQDEAEIYFHSVSKDFPDRIIAVSDIGGGSVQVVIGKDREIFETYLFKTGTYFLQEEFSKTHHPSEHELQNAIDYIKNQLESLCDSKIEPNYLVYGSTNIIDFFNAMNLKLRKNVDNNEHPYTIKVNQLKPLYKKIIKYSYEDRMNMYPAEPYYMWAADKALMNIFQISSNLKVDTIIPSNNNISSGILFELAYKFKNG